MERLTDEEAGFLVKLAHGMHNKVWPSGFTADELKLFDATFKEGEELHRPCGAPSCSVILRELTDRGRRLLDEYLNDVKVPETSQE